MAKVFLGGTVNGSKWRDQLMPHLEIEYFNPVVDNWNEEAYQRELLERETCDFCLYVLTPKMTGVYSIAEVVDDSNKRPEKTLLYILAKDGTDEFSPHQAKSIKAVGKMVQKNGGKLFKRFDALVGFLNSYKYL